MYNGEILEADPKLFKCFSPVTIIQEDDDFFIVENTSHQKFKISKGVIFSNQYEIIDNTIELSHSVYDYWYNKEDSEKYSKFNDLFMENISLIFTNMELILKNGAYFALSPSFFSSGGAYIGGVWYCLGSVINSWMKDVKDLKYLDPEMGELLLFKVIGSPLSGSGSVYYWSVLHQQIIKKSLSDTPKSFLGCYKIIREQFNLSQELFDPFEVLQHLLAEINELQQTK